MKKIFKLKTDNIIVGSLVFVTLVAGGALASTRANADADNTTVVDEISVVIPVSCSMLGTVTSAHTDTVTAVSYTEDIGVTDLKVTCNDFNGFSIYAVGFTGNTEGTTTMIGANSNLTIPTGVHNEGDTASSWAMKLTKVTNPGGGDPDITYNPNILNITNGYSNYNVVPSSLTQVVEYKDNNGGSSATDQSLGAHVQTTYAAYVSGSQAADTYTGQVKYVLVHPADFATGTYNIAYNANGGSGSMTGETGVHNYEPFTLPASTFTPPNGYVLAGWCTVRDQTQNPQTTCTGDSYADQGNIPASTVAAGNPTPTLNLYAYWKVLPTINDLSYMQDFATLSGAEKTSVLGSMTTGTQYQLKDNRDQKDYYISKLLDGNVWMTQNLELDLDSTAVAGSANALTSENTNLKTYGSNGYDSNNGYSCSNAQTTTNCTASGEVITWVPVRSTVTSIDSNNFPNTAAANSTSYSYNPGDQYYYPGTSDVDTPYNLAECEAQNYTDCAHYKAGNYYNWSASVASNNTSSYTGNNTDAGNSVCPKGWRLPKKSANEFQSLVDAYGITATNALNLRNSPLYFVRSGLVNGGSLRNAASDGYYWSSTVLIASYAYSLYFYSGYLNPANYYNRYYGFPVRCVAE